MKRFFAAVLITTLFTACGGEKETATKVAQQANNEFKVIPLTIESEKRKLSDLIESIEVLGLEETDEGLLSGVYNFSQANNRLVFPSGTKGDVFVYTDQGKFISTFNRQGDGPEEYGLLQSFWVKNDTLFVHDSQRGSVNQYDIDGKYLGQLKLNVKPTHLYPYQDGYVGDMSGKLINDSLKFNLVFYDEQLNVIGMENPYKDVIPFPIVTTLNSLAGYGNDLLYKEIFSDTVFIIEDDVVRPLLKIDFGGQYLWNNEKMRANGQMAMEGIQKGDKVWIFNPKVGESKIYLNFNTGFTEAVWLMIDRDSGEYVQIDVKKNAGENYTFSPIRWNGDVLLASLNSFDLAELIREIGAENTTFKQGSTLESIESSENPVLLWVKFKEF
ncbi:6-bladed beta-propeller [Roseivirga echinicomitans]